MHRILWEPIRCPGWDSARFLRRKITFIRAWHHLVRTPDPESVIDVRDFLASLIAH